MTEIADERAVGEGEVARRGRGEPGEHAEQRGLAGSVRTGDEQEVPGGERYIDALEDALGAEAFGEVAGRQHVSVLKGARGTARTVIPELFVARACNGGPLRSALLERYRGSRNGCETGS